MQTNKKTISFLQKRGNIQLINCARAWRPPPQFVFYLHLIMHKSIETTAPDPRDICIEILENLYPDPRDIWVEILENLHITFGPHVIIWWRDDPWCHITEKEIKELHISDYLRCLFFTTFVKLDTVVAVGLKDSHSPVDCWWIIHFQLRRRTVSSFVNTFLGRFKLNLQILYFKPV